MHSQTHIPVPDKNNAMHHGIFTLTRHEE